MRPQDNLTKFEIPDALWSVLRCCESFCVGGCCGRDAFDLAPESVGHSVRLMPQHVLLAARQQLDQLIPSLEGIQGPVDTLMITDQWSGPDAAQWFSDFRQVLDAAARAVAATD